MKSVQYIGEEEVSLGRFGLIKKGAKIDVYEWEWDGLQNDTQFRLLTPMPSKDEMALAAKVRPVPTTFFDLRSIPWEKTGLHKSLSARMSKPVLIKLIKAINQAGGYIEDSSVGEPRDALIDKVIAAARSMGWDKSTKEERYVEPSAEQGTHQEQERVKAARQRVKKQVENENNDNNL